VDTFIVSDNYHINLLFGLCEGVRSKVWDAG